MTAGKTRKTGRNNLSLSLMTTSRGVSVFDFSSHFDTLRLCRRYRSVANLCWRVAVCTWATLSCALADFSGAPWSLGPYCLEFFVLVPILIETFRQSFDHCACSWPSLRLSRDPHFLIRLFLWSLSPFFSYVRRRRVPLSEAPKHTVPVLMSAVTPPTAYYDSLLSYLYFH